MNSETSQRLSRKQLLVLLAERDCRIAELERQVTDLSAQVARLLKNSSNSSKPPSSDIVKPPKPPAANGSGKIGGQPGHPRHERKPFGPDEIDRIENLDIERCPDCGGRVKRAPVAPRVIQRVELVQRPVEVVESRLGGFLCLRCGKIYYAPLPAGGLFGPRLTALVAYLKGACHASFSTVQKFCRDALCVKVSRGQLAKIIHKAGEAMSPAYDDLRRGLPLEKVLNVDETGHKDSGKGYWTWCFRAELYTLFKIDPSRGSEVLLDVLGRQYEGILGCDYFSAYRKYMGECDVLVQFCLAHLIRDVKFLTTHPDRVIAAYGERVLEKLKALFHVIHRREKMKASRFQRALEKARRELVAVGKRAPERSEARNIAERFRRHAKAYFQFITTPGIEPTNNLAEQAIRFVVLDRHVTQGTRGEAGRRWCERIWTAIATCQQQGKSVFEYLHQTISAYFAGRPTPSLLPAGP